MNSPGQRSTVVSVFNNNPPLDAVQTLTDMLATDALVPGRFSERSLRDTHTVVIRVDVAEGDEPRVRQLAASVRAMIRRRGADVGGTIIKIDIADQLTHTAY